MDEAKIELLGSLPPLLTCFGVQHRVLMAEKMPNIMGSTIMIAYGERVRSSNRKPNPPLMQPGGYARSIQSKSIQANNESTNLKSSGTGSMSNVLVTEVRIWSVARTQKT